MHTSEVLYTAANLIESDGWWGRGNQESPYCAGNAIYTVGKKSIDVYLPAQRALWTYLGGESLSAIWRWNDEEGRTAEEVLEVLRAAAVIEAAKEQAASDLADALGVAPVGVRA